MAVLGGLVLLLFKFFFKFQLEISELPQSIALKLCHVIGSMFSFIPKIWGPYTATKFCGCKKRAKFGAISDNFKLRSPISAKWIKISKIGKLMYRQRFLWRSEKNVR